MLYERKFQEEVSNGVDRKLAFAEYNVSIYEKIANYLAENKCSDGMCLVNKYKEEMINFITTTKDALSEIEYISAELTKLIENLYIQKQGIPSTIAISNRNIFIMELTVLR